MECAFPINHLQNGIVGCGQCMPCRINQKRVVVARILLEWQLHDWSTFCTLTYDDCHVPICEDGPTLYRRDITKFLKRYRKRIAAEGRPLRFFCVGEYGDRTHRPHYHLVLFGHNWTDRPAIESCWGKGFVQVDELTPERASYVAHYCTKKMTNKQKRLLEDRREPEFATRSKNPALGAGAVDALAKAYESKEGALYLSAYGDIERTFRMYGREYPIDAYIAGLLRARLGIRLSAKRREAAKPEGAPRREIYDEVFFSPEMKAKRESVHAKLVRRYGEAENSKSARVL